MYNLNKRPEVIIWITTDHMRFDFIGAYGNEVVHTPNLNFLANNGVNFMNCFCQNGVCMPSRASFMTGLYPQQTGITHNGHNLPDDFEPVAPRLLKSAGYSTAHIGKLHLQSHEDHDLDTRERNTYGFDTFWLSEARGCYEDSWMTWLRSTYPEHVNKFRVPRAPDRTGEERRGTVLEAPWEASQSAWIVHMAQNYLGNKFGGRENSYQFLNLGFHCPHPPLNPTSESFKYYQDVEIQKPEQKEAEWNDKPDPLAKMLKSRQDWEQKDFIEYKRYFYALITEFDLAIGKLLDYLRNNNMLDDTLIIFNSDHGDMCGDHSLTHKGPHFYDEVFHVPWIMFWPEGFGKERIEVDSLTEMVDVLPTIMELASGRIDSRFSGRSYANELLKGKIPTGREDVIAFHNPDWAMIRTKDYKYILYIDHNSEILYDLKRDPDEYKNYINDEDYQEIVKNIRFKMLKRFISAGRSYRFRENYF